MDNQHKLIRGYRELSQEEIDLMNKVKATGEQLGDLVDELRSLVSTDKRWLEIGKTDLQTGIMALVRSIAKPTTF
jgi:hypothetical protein